MFVLLAKPGLIEILVKIAFVQMNIMKMLLKIVNVKIYKNSYFFNDKNDKL